MLLKKNPEVAETPYDGKNYCCFLNDFYGYWIMLCKIWPTTIMWVLPPIPYYLMTCLGKSKGIFQSPRQVNEIIFCSLFGYWLPDYTLSFAGPSVYLNIMVPLLNWPTKYFKRSSCYALDLSWLFVSCSLLGYLVPSAEPLQRRRLTTCSDIIEIKQMSKSNL